MTKIEITEWGELVLIEELLTDWTLKHGVRAPHHSDAISLLKRIRPALIEATNNIS